MSKVLNVSAYRFTGLADLPALRPRLFDEAASRGLKGTVLLAEEGINLALAGTPQAVRGWLETLGHHAGLHGLQVKESYSAAMPLRHLRVRIKREIIRMNQPAIRPADERAPAVAPLVLARWLAQGHDDDGRAVVMLDTRNAFEVDAGAFDGALDWRLGRFSDFPAALARHAPALRDKTVVSYCTGGIRCEKAALALRQAGITHARQLDGGILQYFQDTGGRAPGWHGRCFVFDERVALDPALQPAADMGGPA